ncbi:MAG: alpha/beta fold hydrolase [Acidobacteriota bacterium]|nr:alpha/beta fold hydrolase [Acidobacteriota bacterium]
MENSPGKFRLWWRRWRWRLLAIYLLLVLAAHVWQWWDPADNFSEPESCPTCRSALLNAIDGDRHLKQQIRFVYQDRGQPTVSGEPALPIVLIHGSPGEARDFDQITPMLESSHRLIIPDLPGFGASTRDIPDYSFRTHAKYLIELLDQLKIERAHFLGFSMGGGVVLNLYDLAPERVASATMLAAIGVQEMELLGDYHLNHAVHGLQLGLFWLLREGLPLSPTSHARDFSVSFSRNFYDSDQRPLRALLSRFDKPMLIVHGQHDFLVPVEAAREHHRLVPQSELAVSDYDHFMVFNRKDYLAPLLADFTARAETGTALTKDKADPIRVAAAQQPFDPKNLPKFIGVTAFVVVLLLAAATLITEDLTCITAGVMVAQGRLDFALAAFACFLGIYVGDLLLFLAGRWLGRAALSRAPVKWLVSERAVERGSEWFQHQGAKVIFISRFLPGARLPTYFAAGALRTSFWKFALYFAIACAVWTPLLVGLAMLLGKGLVESALFAGQGVLLKAFIAAILIYLIVKTLIRLSTWRGRRLMVSSWRRMTNWEFWPAYVFYPPVVVYIGWLMLKHRSLTLFTVSNPAIPGGGFIGESKAEIYRGLATAKEFLPKWKMLGASATVEDRINQAKGFIAENNLSFPVVLKPDAGQRGSGVGFIHSDAELESYLRQANVDTLIQEFLPGEEFGVFYYRYPNQNVGKIFAITEKRFPTVTGDGNSTLEQLILNDSRAVCMAGFLLDKHSDRLWEQPVVGETVKLVDLGTHCRGAIFLDGDWVKTDELEVAIDGICQQFDGFYFGRFDIRTPNVNEFRQGKNFKVIELNGVTSEATSIYDPKNSVFAAYRILFRQWRIAFEIGAQNRERGFKPTQLRTLLKWMIVYREQSQAHDSFNKTKQSQPAD